MRWLLAGLALAVVAVLRSAIEAEAQALLTKLPEWIVRAACRALPKRVRARYRDEMLADLDMEPDRPLWRIAITLRMLARIPLLAWTTRGNHTGTDGIGTPAEATPHLVTSFATLQQRYWALLVAYAEEEGLTTDEASVLVREVLLYKWPDLLGASMDEAEVQLYEFMFHVFDWNLWINVVRPSEPPDESNAS